MACPLGAVEALSATLAPLAAADLAAAGAASRALRAGVEAAARAALARPGAGAAWRPAPGLGWAEALRRAREWPRLVVLGGEDARDEPQLHLSLVSPRRGDGAGLARHRALPGLPAGRYRLSASRVGLGVFVAGGTGPEGDACTEMLRLDALTHKVELAAGARQMPTPRYGHESVCVQGRYLLCIGGKAACAADAGARRQDAEVGGSADCLDTVSGEWRPLPCRLAHPRIYFGAAVTGSIVVVCGGSALAEGAGGTESRLGSTELLDASELPRLFDPGSGGAPPAMAWQRGPDLLFPRYDFSLAGPLQGLLFAVGGSGARKLVEVMDTSALEAWLEAPRAGPRSGQSSPAAGSARTVRQQLLAEGWADVHAQAGGALRGGARAPLGPTLLAAVALELARGTEQGGSPRAGGGSGRRPAGWHLHPVELPDTRSCGAAVALGGGLCLLGGSQRAVLSYRLGDPSWVPTGVELDSMRLGARVVAIGYP